jgi:hypothetical protein
MSTAHDEPARGNEHAYSLSAPATRCAASSSDIRPPASRAERFDLRSVGSIDPDGGRTAVSRTQFRPQASEQGST